MLTEALSHMLGMSVGLALGWALCGLLTQARRETTMIESHLPERFEHAMVGWLRYGQQPGHFLTAVLCNDLREAFSRADDDSVNELPGIMAWLYNWVPSCCWGSVAKVDAWEALPQEERDRVLALAHLDDRTRRLVTD